MSRAQVRVMGVVLSLVMSGSVALALDPLGAPQAGPAAGQFQLGANLLLGSTDLDIHDRFSSQVFENGVLQPNESVSGRQTYTQRNKSVDRLHANLGYGVLRNWEVFLRVGQAEAGLGEGPWFAFGGGTKVTFYETGPWTFGGILQATWTGVNERNDSRTSPTEYVTTSNQYSVTEFQGALGANYKLNDSISLYGGPLAHFIRGTWDSKTRTVSGTRERVSKDSSDIRETSWFGGYLGAQVQVHPQVVASMEYQYTDGAQALAVGCAYRFGL